MASYDFGLDATEDVARKLGIDVDSIGASTSVLKTADVTAALASGCSTAVAAAFGRGITADADLLTSDPDTHQKLKDLAQAHAVSKLARDHGRLPEVEQRWYARAMELQSMLSGTPGQFGSGAGGVTSNLTSTMDSPTTGDAYEIGGLDWTSSKVF